MSVSRITEKRLKNHFPKFFGGLLSLFVFVSISIFVPKAEAQHLLAEVPTDSFPGKPKTEVNISPENIYRSIETTAVRAVSQLTFKQYFFYRGVGFTQ